MDAGEAGGKIRVQSVFRRHGRRGVVGEEGHGAAKNRGDQGEMGKEKAVCEGG